MVLPRVGGDISVLCTGCPTLLAALSAIASLKVNPMETTLEKVKQILDYCATEEEMVITYRASEMIFALHSDAGYLNKFNAQSRAGGEFYLSKNVLSPQ